VSELVGTSYTENSKGAALLVVKYPLNSLALSAPRPAC
jgi:hypothetical protein